MNLGLFVPYTKQRVRFENICFKVILFYAENLITDVGNFGTIIGAKSVRHLRFRC